MRKPLSFTVAVALSIASFSLNATAQQASATTAQPEPTTLYVTGIERAMLTAELDPRRVSFMADSVPCLTGCVLTTRERRSMLLTFHDSTPRVHRLFLDVGSHHRFSSTSLGWGLPVALGVLGGVAMAAAFPVLMMNQCWFLCGPNPPPPSNAQYLGFYGLTTLSGVLFTGAIYAIIQSYTWSTRPTRIVSLPPPGAVGADGQPVRVIDEP